MDKNFEIAIFGGGCFWCTEAVFRSLKGVKSVVPGYSGGSKETATYEKVSGGKTGHIETIKIEYDPSVISYSDLLNVFFHTHNPTTPNRQGADIGEQYKSIIFYLDQNQKNEAENMLAKLTKEKTYEDPIITKIEPFAEFFEAEEYHKNYYERNKNATYCEVIITPKIEKLEKRFRELIKNEI